ncbi:MAG TPA: 2TM domain-containing protein [Planctomicrobium sp.]|nr:2TM domain-containing protein [Planctomicrobium sp.]
MTITHMSHDEAESRAQKNFYVHLAVYVVVNTGLAVLNLVNNPEHLWFYWPLAGWGLGVALHGIAVFVTGKAADRVIERQERREERQERRESRRQDQI